MKNDWLCELMEEEVKGMPAGNRELFTEAIRRLKNDNDILEVRIVEAAKNLISLRKILDNVLAINTELERDLKAERKVLHVQYDLEASDCGAVLQEGEDKYCVSARDLAEMLEAKLDGRLMILPKEEHDGSENQDSECSGL